MSLNKVLIPTTMRTIACFIIATAITMHIHSVEPQKVFVGTYLENAEGIDLQNNRYYLRFQIWLRWKGSLDPTKALQFVNLIDEWGLTKKPIYKRPKLLKGGYKYQRFIVEGSFFHKFWLGTFPLDWQKVILEMQNNSYGRSKIVFVPDLENSYVNSKLAIPGWQIRKTYNEEYEFEYKSQLGEKIRNLRFSRYRFGLKIQRPLRFYLLKVIPPILITLLCCILVFYLHVSYVDARLSTAIAALLTEVFYSLVSLVTFPVLAQ